MRVNGLSQRECRVLNLASSINGLMREHTDRNEAIDAYDMARILFRKTIESTHAAQGQLEDRAVVLRSS